MRSLLGGAEARIDRLEADLDSIAATVEAEARGRAGSKRKNQRGVIVELDLRGGRLGLVRIVWSGRSALSLVSVLLGRKVRTLGTRERSALSEVGNVIASAIAGKLAEPGLAPILPTPPRLRDADVRRAGLRFADREDIDLSAARIEWSALDARAAVIVELTQPTPFLGSAPGIR